MKACEPNNLGDASYCAALSNKVKYRALDNT